MCKCSLRGISEQDHWNTERKLICILSHLPDVFCLAGTIVVKPMDILTTQTFNCLNTVYAGAIFCYCCIKLLDTHTHEKYWHFFLNTDWEVVKPSLYWNLAQHSLGFTITELIYKEVCWTYTCVNCFRDFTTHIPCN